MQESSTGCLRRRILMRATDNRATAGVEDDFHHFIVTIEHDNDVVIDIGAQAPRAPWTVCADAATMLPQFIGLRLSVTPAIDPALIDYHRHCTHQYDLACLAIAQAARGGTRQYDIEVLDSKTRDKTARLYRNGELYWEWQMHRSAFVAPTRFAGLDLRSIGPWAQQHLDDDEREALMVLRRGFMISGGRGLQLDTLDDTGSDRFKAMSGACYAYQPERLGKGRRNKGSTRDFSDTPNQLLRELEPTPLQWR
jgi:hypothetical protein